MTGAAGVMVANGLLQNPWAFDRSMPSPGPTTAVAMAREYLEFAARYPPPTTFYGRCVRDHLQYILERDLKPADRALWGVLDNPKLVSPNQFRLVMDLVESKLNPAKAPPAAPWPTLREVLRGSAA